MELLPYEEFGTLRLASLLRLPVSPPDPKDPGSARRFKKRAVIELKNWEAMDRIWVGEAVGFSEWLRLEKEPDVLRLAFLDLKDLPGRVSARILDALRLPLKRGMTLQEVKAVLGKPTEARAFVAGRTSFTFSCGTREKYRVDCTLDDKEGLVYLVVMRTDRPRTIRRG